MCHTTDTRQSRRTVPPSPHEARWFCTVFGERVAWFTVADVGENDEATPWLTFINYCPCKVVLMALVALSTIFAATSNVSVYW